MMNNTERIHALLEDRSFPSMVLLDGHWGVGKTYYVKNELLPYLKRHYTPPFKTIYLSLYGVTSLDDFKDRILSLTYTENKKSSWLAKQGSDLIGSSAQALSGTRGVAAALGGVASIVKYHYFNKIDNLVLVLDDLERITCDNIRTQVIGECLNLTENKQHVKIVVVGNQDKIGAHEDVEKAFSDIVHLNRAPSETIEVIKTIYTGTNALNEHELATISNCIESLELDNLRIIQRAIKRYKSISGLYTKKEGIDYTHIESQLIETSFRVTTAIRRDGFKPEEVISALDFAFQLELPDIDNNKQQEKLSEADERKSKLEDYIDPIRYHTSKNLVSYIATYENNFNFVEQELGLPTETEEINMFLSYGFMKEDDLWLNQNIDVLLEHIHYPSSRGLLHWTRCCNVYAFLLESGYVEGELNDFYSLFQERLDKHDFGEEKFSEEIEDDIDRYLRDSKLRDIFRTHLKHSKEALNKGETELFNSLFINSYMSARSKVRTQFMRTAFLQRFTEDQFKQILSNWTAEDVLSFSNDMNSRYSFRNLESCFSEELESLIFILKISKQMNSKSKHGIKKGNLKVLYESMQSLVTRLEERITPPNTGQDTESVATSEP